MSEKIKYEGYMAKQIRVFLDNKPGRLEKVTGVLAAKGVNVRAMLISDRGEFGIVKFLVDKPDLTIVVLKDAGFAAAVKEVVAVRLDDKIGRLHDMIEFLSSRGINISDGYGFAGHSVFCLETEGFEEAARLLKENGFYVLSDQELYET
ncbi:MAG: ACT domain-containing protein [Candidatus Omnitrophica bacterium]|nr:ACT domain-containing protein [Candidatus Omnitrophota bacterium]